MDVATIIGVLLGLGLMVWAIASSTSLMTFVDVPSAAIVIGGAIAAVLVAFPLKQVFKILGVVKKAFFATPSEPVEHVATLVHLAEIARRDGILSLESHLAEGNYDDFLVRGLRMAIDGQDPAVIEAAMEREVETIMDRHATGKGLFDSLGKYAPAFGMLGTVVGLIIMLQNMDDAKSLGPAMAVALITTFYGALIANLLALPIADKLALRSSEELASKILIVRGVMAIQAGDNPRIVLQKLMAFLDARQRELAEEKTGKN